MLRDSNSAASTSTRVTTIPPSSRKPSGLKKTGQGQRITLTSKHNWWLIDVEETAPQPSPPLPSARIITDSDRPPVDVSPPQFKATPHPASSIFGHLPQASTPYSSTSTFNFSAPQDPTARLAPIATGSTSELFKCVVKKPDIVQLEINGEMQTNAWDVTAQFLAELRVYTTISGHLNFPAYLGALDGIGMVLEFIDGRSLLDVLTHGRSAGGLDRLTKINFHDQLLDGLAYLHSFGLSHGDLSLLNVLVTRNNTLKIIDFGRSTSRTSIIRQPSEPRPEPDIPGYLQRPIVPASQTVTLPGHDKHGRPHHTITLQLDRSPSPSPPSTPRPIPQRTEQIHPGTRPFSAPEIAHEECLDPILADAYSFGMVLFCIDLGGLVNVDERAQLRWEIPDLSGCEIFPERIKCYLKEPKERMRISKDSFMGR